MLIMSVPPIIVEVCYWECERAECLFDLFANYSSLGFQVFHRPNSGATERRTFRLPPPLDLDIPLET